MSATLSVTPAPRSGWHAVLDCTHGTTHVAVLNPEAAGLQRQDAVRLALLRHYAETRCRCARRLWRRAFGAPLGQVVLVRGRVG